MDQSYLEQFYIEHVMHHDARGRSETIREITAKIKGVAVSQENKQTFYAHKTTSEHQPLFAFQHQYWSINERQQKTKSAKTNNSWAPFYFSKHRKRDPKITLLRKIKIR